MGRVVQGRRKFGDQFFTFYSERKWKHEAKEAAKNLKKAGYQARVVKTKHGYEVWRRGRRKRRK